MKRLKLLILIAVMLLGFSREANAVSYQAVADSLMAQLKFQKTAEDSLKMLYNIFDASDQRKKILPGRMVLDLAKRTNNQLALIDFIPQVTTLVVRDSLMMEEMMNYTKSIEDPEHAKTVRLFIMVKKAAEEANYIPDSELREVLLKYARDEMTPTGDFYKDILDLYRMVIFLGNSKRGNLYLEYLTRLEEMIAKIPLDFGYLLNLYYTTAANFHTRTGNHAKAVEMDRKILEVIGNLEKRYSDMGRPYRDYSRYYYICYRRMLCNYPALSLNEINDLYAKCAFLAESDPEVAADFYGEGRPTIYRLMAVKDYKEAVPKIKKALPVVKDNAMRRRLLGMLVQAADSVHDNATLLSALKEYNNMLMTAIDEQSAEAYSELQIRYDLNRLKSEKERLAMEKKEAEVATNQRVISVALAGVLVLVVVLMFLYRSNFSLKRRMRDTREENDHLHQTIEEMLGDSALKGTLDVRRGSPQKKK
ncbi:MAG: hypothetical protein K2L34_08530 [Muribaculaceae bacterium]|nr:hypothetical protein [Muribaculaceae bacterium]